MTLFTTIMRNIPIFIVIIAILLMMMISQSNCFLSRWKIGGRAVFSQKWTSLGGNNRSISETLIVPETQKYDAKSYSIPLLYRPFIDHVIIPEFEIQNRVNELAQQIVQDHSSAQKLHLLCVLKGRFHSSIFYLRLFISFFVILGSSIFFHDLLRAISKQLESENICVDSFRF
jgi:hypothetical protein